MQIIRGRRLDDHSHSAAMASCTEVEAGDIAETV